MASDANGAESVKGSWHPAGSGLSVTATLQIPDGGLFVVADEAGAKLTSGAFGAVEISPRVGSIPRRLTFGDGSVFMTGDNDAVDAAIAPFAGRGAGIVHSLERYHPRLALFAALVVIGAFAIYRFAVPALVEVAVAVTPPVVPHLISQSVLASLDSTVFGPSALDERTRQKIAAGFAELDAFTPRGIEGFTLNFRKGGQTGPNAFSLPDGTVVLTDELVELVKDDETVLGVLAHEIGHVEHQHNLRQLYRAAGVSGLILLIGGDIGGGAQDILIQGSALISLSYSRAMEAEADRYSVELMLKAGRDPAAIVRFLEIIRDKYHDTATNDFLSTHPATPGRIEDVRRYAEELTATGKE